MRRPRDRSGRTRLGKKTSPSHSQVDDKLALFAQKAQIAFWLLAAIDGHAKNFSVFLHPRSGFKMTPLYDVMSAQHLFNNKQIQRKQMKLAMSVGKNNHYHIHEIQPRHYSQMVKKARISDAMVELALSQVADDLPGAIEAAIAGLPSAFPADIRDSIAEGALSRCEILTAATAEA